jgi:hypothetical protein
MTVIGTASVFVNYAFTVNTKKYERLPDMKPL